MSLGSGVLEQTTLSYGSSSRLSTAKFHIHGVSFSIIPDGTTTKQGIDVTYLYTDVRIPISNGNQLGYVTFFPLSSPVVGLV